jgi:hypothetical protein
VDELLARFPEVPRDLRDEPILAEYVKTFGPLLRMAQKPSPCVGSSGDAQHVFYTRLANDLAIYAIGLATHDRTLVPRRGSWRTASRLRLKVRARAPPSQLPAVSRRRSKTAAVETQGAGDQRLDCDQVVQHRSVGDPLVAALDGLEDAPMVRVRARGPARRVERFLSTPGPPLPVLPVLVVAGSRGSSSMDSGWST